MCDNRHSCKSAQTTEDRDRPFHVLEYHRRYRNAELIKYMPYRPGLCVLDCGCGEGVLLDQLDGRTGAAWGIDCSLSALCPSQGPEQVAAARYERLPFAAGMFDVVFGQDSLRDVEDPTHALREFARVLRPGGRLILGESRSRTCYPTMADRRNQMRAVGLVPVCEEPFGYTSYPIATVIGHVPLLQRSVAIQSLIKVTFAIDDRLVHLPALYDKSWYQIVVAEKGEDPCIDPRWTFRSSFPCTTKKEI